MCSFCTRLMDSRPPATMIGTLSTITRCAAIAIACRPDEQKRLTVVPAVVTGSPARSAAWRAMFWPRSEEHTSELQSRLHLVCRLLLEKKKKNKLHAHVHMHTTYELHRSERVDAHT